MISRWVSPRLLSNYHLSAGTWEYVRVCRCPLGVCFLQPSSSLLQSPWVGESHPGLDASLLGENPCSCGSLSICELPTQGFGCCLYLISAPPTHLMVISSLYLKNLFCQFSHGSHRQMVCSVQFSRSVVSDSLQPHGLQHTRPPCPSPAHGFYSNSCPLSP